MLLFAQQTASSLQSFLEILSRYGEELLVLWFFSVVTFLLTVPPTAYLIKKYQERQHRHEERLAMIQVGMDPDERPNPVAK